MSDADATDGSLRWEEPGEDGGEGGLPRAPRPGSLPDWLAGPAADVLEDLGDAAGLLLRGGYLPDEETTTLGHFFVCGQDGRMLYGFGIPLELAAPELTVVLAEGVQEHLFEVPGAEGHVHPPCPGHLHAAIAAVTNGAAWWICPQTRRALRRIGSAAARDIG